MLTYLTSRGQVGHFGSLEVEGLADGREVADDREGHLDWECVTIGGG